MKMKKTIAFLTVLACFMGALSAKPDEKKLSVWSFTDEIEGFLETKAWGYKATHPDVEIEYSMTPTDQFPDKLDKVLLSGKNCPDVIALEDAFVRKYVESDQLLPLDDLYNEVKGKIEKYPVQVGSYNGHVYAMSWQVAPGAMFYRRSLAKKYLGTDDPKKVQKYFSNMNKMLETARLLKKKSGGRCRTLSTAQDLFHPFKGIRKKPWVVNDKLVIDPAMEKYMEMYNIFEDEGLSLRGLGQWSEEWFAGMNDMLIDDRNNPIEIFCYFLPTWGLHYVLKINAPETSGDWAMCQGPSAWRWGGTWIAAYKGTKNPELAKEMIKYLTTDDAFLKALAITSGDNISNVNVQKTVQDLYVEPYLGGQNHYKEFCEYAKKVNGSLTQGTDMLIEALFNEAVYEYVYDGKSKEDAIEDFKGWVETELGR